MPRYCYSCRECDAEFEVSHSLHESYAICKICSSSDCLDRIPSEIFLAKKDGHLSQFNEAGTLVKEAISETREELQKEQDALRNRIYKK